MRVRGQFLKNIGNPVEVLTRDGRKLHAVLRAVSDDTSSITLEHEVKVKEPGAKRPVVRTEELTLPLADVKYCVYEIKF